MTRVQITLDLKSHLDALHFAESIDAQKMDPTIAGKAGLDQLSKHIAPIWEEIRIAIESSVASGEAFVEDLWQSTSNGLKMAAESAAVSVSDLSEVLRQRLLAYIKHIEDTLLENISGVITVGGIEMTLQNVDIQKTVKLSSSLKASLVAAVSFAAGGEMSIKANYEKK